LRRAVPRGIATDSLSVWIVPGGRARRALTREIRALAARHGGPLFEPHVTLLSGMEPAEADRARAGLAAAAKRIPPLSIHVGDVGHAPAHFRCLYLCVKLTPALREAREALRRALRPRCRAGYFPHLSLLYAALPKRARQALAATIVPGKTRSAFVAASVRLQATCGRPEEWRAVADYPLTGTSRPAPRPQRP
jgi:2'-5' RNA ligase